MTATQQTAELVRKLLATRPRTTTELAKQLHLSKRQVLRALKVIQDDVVYTAAPLRSGQAPGRPECLWKLV